MVRNKDTKLNVQITYQDGHIVVESVYSIRAYNIEREWQEGKSHIVINNTTIPTARIKDLIVF